MGRVAAPPLGATWIVREGRKAHTWTVREGRTAQVAAAGAADAVAAILGDFLAVDAASFPAARAVLVDPSCSGSGMPALERTEGGVEISTKKSPSR